MVAKKRGGRKRGEWTLVKPETLREWRGKNKVSRARVASMLGVSTTSVQNWETGLAIATTKTQRRLAELTSAAATSLPSLRSGSPLMRTSGEDEALQATGAIVAEYSKGAARLSPDELVTLVRAVRQALR